MKVLMTVVLLSFATLCSTTHTTYAQDRAIRWDENQQLSWNDFAGKVNDTSPFDAECFAEVRYHYRFYTLKDYEFDVYASFDKKTSWSRKENQSDALLKHEQMHFDIAQLFAQKLKDQFASFAYTANFDAEIRKLFWQIKTDYQVMQHQYDEETNHSLNKKKQKEWELFVASELKKQRLQLQLAENRKRFLKEEFEIAQLSANFIHL